MKYRGIELPGIYIFAAFIICFYFMMRIDELNSIRLCKIDLRDNNGLAIHINNSKNFKRISFGKFTIPGTRKTNDGATKV
jgi:hypothetical protein